MNLKQFLIENPAADLTTVQTYSLDVDKKQVGSGSARGWFVQEGIWKNLKAARDNPEHPASDLADAVIITASDASSYFGLDPDTAEGQGNIDGASALVATNIMTEDQMLEFLAKAIKITYPFSDTTQAVMDTTLLAIETDGTMDSLMTSYSGGNDNIVKRVNRDLLIKVRFNAPVTHATQVNIFAHLSSDGIEYTKESRAIGSLNFPVGVQSLILRVSKSFASRKLKLTGVANKLFSFAVDVTEA